MSKLAALYLSEMRFGKVSHLKDRSQSFLAQSDPEESINLQSIKNRIHSMIFCCYVQDSGNMTFWRLGDINFQFFFELRLLDLIERLTARSQISNCNVEVSFSGSLNVLSDKNGLRPYKFFQSVHL